MAAAPDQRARAEDTPGDRDGQVVLAQVKHVSPGREGHIRTVVHREQAAMPPVNGEVVPRGSWAGAALRHGDQVEVVTAVQGG